MAKAMAFLLVALGVIYILVVRMAVFIACLFTIVLFGSAMVDWITMQIDLMIPRWRKRAGDKGRTVA